MSGVSARTSTHVAATDGGRAAARPTDKPPAPATDKAKDTTAGAKPPIDPPAIASAAAGQQTPASDKAAVPPDVVASAPAQGAATLTAEQVLAQTGTQAVATAEDAADGYRGFFGKMTKENQDRFLAHVPKNVSDKATYINLHADDIILKLGDKTANGSPRGPAYYLKQSQRDLLLRDTLNVDVKRAFVNRHWAEVTTYGKTDKQAGKAYEDGQLMLQFNEGASAAEKASVYKALGITAKDATELGLGFTQVALKKGMSVPDAVLTMKTKAMRSVVKSATPNYRLAPAAADHAELQQSAAAAQAEAAAQTYSSNQHGYNPYYYNFNYGLGYDVDYTSIDFQDDIPSANASHGQSTATAAQANGGAVAAQQAQTVAGAPWLAINVQAEAAPVESTVGINFADTSDAYDDYSIDIKFV
jgi:hypothetical protein